jgi:hypothetical protein
MPEPVAPMRFPSVGHVAALCSVLALLAFPTALVAQIPGPEQETRPAGFRLIAVGDVMPGTEFPDAGYLDPRLTPDAGPEAVLGEPLTEVLRAGDVVLGNMEGVLWDEDVPPSKACKDPKACYVFRGPERYAGLLAEAGFTVMSLANNHSGDWGAEGREATMAALAGNGIAFAGLAAAGGRTATLVLDSGIRIGVAAFSPNKGTLSINDPSGAAEIVGSLAAEHDVVVVSFHGGAEGSSHTALPKERETFYGENRGDVYAFSHAMVDAGADVVIGHGPHVPRAVEVYEGRFIAYSLGNFWTYGRFNLRGPNGLAPVVDLQVAADGRVIGARIHGARQEGRGGPRLDPSNAACALITELTARDLPEARMEFGPDCAVRWPGMPRTTEVRSSRPEDE